MARRNLRRSVAFAGLAVAALALTGCAAVYFTGQVDTPGGYSEADDGKCVIVRGAGLKFEPCPGAGWTLGPAPNTFEGAPPLTESEIAECGERCGRESAHNTARERAEIRRDMAHDGPALFAYNADPALLVMLDYDGRNVFQRRHRTSRHVYEWREVSFVVPVPTREGGS